MVKKVKSKAQSFVSSLWRSVKKSIWTQKVKVRITSTKIRRQEISRKKNQIIWSITVSTSIKTVSKIQIITTKITAINCLKIIKKETNFVRITEVRTIDLKCQATVQPKSRTKKKIRIVEIRKLQKDYQNVLISCLSLKFLMYLKSKKL